MELKSLADLLDLQDVDLQIDRLIDRRQSLPELETYKVTHEQLATAEREKSKAATALKAAERELDKAEGELELLEIKLDEHETRLFAGGMSARETEHMRLEVEGLRGQKSALEDKVLAMLDELDPSRASVSDLEKTVADLKQAEAGLETVIKKEWSVIDAELARKEERKQEAIAPIAPDLLELYEKLRDIKEGVAVAPYDHGVCGGCHMALSPAEEQEAFSDDLPRCVHCRRILVA